LSTLIGGPDLQFTYQVEAKGGKVMTTDVLFTICDTLVKIKRASDYVNPIYTFPKTALSSNDFQIKEIDYSKFTTERNGVPIS
jgi:hypothetical protein